MLSSYRRLEGKIVIFASSLVLMAFGSIHAFSLLVSSLEIRFSASRNAVSMTYSLALIALTLAVFIGQKLFFRFSAASFLLCVCGMAACGAIIAGMADSLITVWLGFGVMFGFANGLAYGFGLQISAQFNSGHEGFAIGIITASYAFGAVLAPPLFEIAIEARGFSSAMIGLASFLVITGLLSTTLMRSVDAKLSVPRRPSHASPVIAHGQFLLWLGYFGGVLAGLMVIGHAVGIATVSRPDMSAWLPATVIAACNFLGSLVFGRLSDRMPLGFLLAGLALLTLAGLCGVIFLGNDGGLLISLGTVGFAYGGTIAAYPAAVVKLYGVKDSSLIYGRIFTAWGSAGLLGPWLAGYLFDMRGDYEIALIAAAAVGLLSFVSISVLIGKYWKFG